ncbi:M23 family metallopeptidase [Novosphingobium flavum]|uniref:M23 family metallopeptidase n=2 Tax=Novosphingobium flavum TaxID=1778672 RepID=A0A7X1FTS2_9SPHN|nr:M23 family metallopeptidase [Novosphingobium flavum]MBC2666302.1 M23 family metallopeptidase [Novosphingobium flavum]
MTRLLSSRGCGALFGAVLAVCFIATGAEAKGGSATDKRFAVIAQSGEGAGDPGPAHIQIGPALDLVGNPVDLSAIALARNMAAADPAALMPGVSGLMPVSGRAVTSRFGMRFHPLLGVDRLHAGIDLAAPMGSPVVATADGIVGHAGALGGYGLLVGIKGSAGLETRYAHLSKLNVAPGQLVRRGQLLGWSGSTGLSTGPHLHYEVRVNGRAVNPLGH